MTNNTPLYSVEELEDILKTHADEQMSNESYDALFNEIPGFIEEIKRLTTQLSQAKEAINLQEEVSRLQQQLADFQKLKDYTHDLVDFVRMCQNPSYVDIANKAKKIAAPGVKLSELRGILRPEALNQEVK